ncbi:cation:proton antiporter [Nocardiopsis composta]|uniref:Kef-type K+ transport system membrane component KefB n=1 Tax=Nocardiopsis composta TaxID=157465 RepID=A0A7W8VGV7_9ACTN|nr:cation:proton antiporter [Nocardiopsis composta]MBB5436016.1 Kef-type K+ transport system membrane component KefB [Nocardiopsis composta]
MEGETAETLRVLLVILAAAFLAPLVSDRIARWVVVPATVLEILFGIALGPAGAGLIRETEAVAMLSELGLALLMFMAGYEIDFARIKGRPLRRALLAWLCSVALGMAIAAALFGASRTALIIGLALTTTALGTVLPMLRDSGALGGAFGTRFLASGTVGEFGPIVLIAVLLSGFRPAEGTLLLAVFFVLAGLAAWRATRPPSERLGRLLRATLGTSAQLAVRLCMLLVVLLVWLASSMQLDALLGAFAAGVIVRLMLTTNHPQEAEAVESKMDAVGFGFLIPVFFVVTGVRFDLGALLADPPVLLLVPLFLTALLLVRGGPEYLLSRGELAGAERPALALFSATGLPLLVVLTTIGTESGALDGAVAAALVGAGMLSVLVLPQAGGALLRRAEARPDGPARG